MKRTVLVTGSESFVASFLIKKLKKKYNVIGIDCVKKNINTKFAIDITKKIPLKLDKFKIDYIIHLAAISRDNECAENPLKCFNTNVIGTLNLINFANNKKIKNFIFASTQWVYNFDKSHNIKNYKSVINAHNLESEYALSKLVSEINLKQNYKKNKLNSVILRFGIIYGPRSYNLSAFEAIFYKSLEQDKIEIGSKKTGRNFIHIEDICDGIIKAIGKKGYNIFNLEGDEFISLENLINESEIILNKKIKIIEKNPKNPSIKNVSNKFTKKQLNWKPKYSLKKSIINLLNYKNLYRNQLKIN
jgi:nucleoside-diphosphate-sugar epimerase